MQLHRAGEDDRDNDERGHNPHPERDPAPPVGGASLHGAQLFGELAGGKVGTVESAGDDRVQPGRHVLRQLADQARQRGRRRRGRQRDADAPVEAIEVRIAGRVDPDPLGGQRRRLRSSLLERVDGRGQPSGDVSVRTRTRSTTRCTRGWRSGSTRRRS
jgi:hypothetical protein